MMKDEELGRLKTLSIGEVLEKVEYAAFEMDKLFKLYLEAKMKHDDLRWHLTTVLAEKIKAVDGKTETLHIFGSAPIGGMG